MRREGDIEAAAASPVTRRLIEAASELRAEPPVPAAAEPQAFAEFTRAYREWIIFERGTPGSAAERTEKSRLLLHSVLGASTIGEALALYARFAKVVWDGAIDMALEAEGDEVALTFNDPLKPGPSGLISAIWSLSLTLCELEFLAGGPLPGVSGRVRNERCLPDYLAAMLFDHPLAYEAESVALVIPRRLLGRAVVVRAQDVPAFVADLVPTALGAGRTPDLASLVAALIRNDRLRGSAAASDLDEVAARLGCSAATVRRRLRAEGAGFRQIKDAVFDDLAKTWLRETDASIEAIAERLGFSDVFAFRRSFRRGNGRSPQAFRRESAETR
jgi:AraC-like DNA-binding protein